jgi:hypothetical protein
LDNYCLDDFLVNEFYNCASSEIHDAKGFINVYYINKHLYDSFIKKVKNEKALEVKEKLICIEKSLRAYIIRCRLGEPLGLKKFLCSEDCPYYCYKFRREDNGKRIREC